MEFKCNICHEIELIREEVTTISSLACGHVFHLMCIRRWFEIKQECPQCRCCVRHRDRPMIEKRGMLQLQLQIGSRRCEPKNTSKDGNSSIRLYRGKLAILDILYQREERTLSLLQDRAKASLKRLALAQVHRKVLRRSLTLHRARVAESEFIQGTVEEAEAVVAEERLTKSQLKGLVVRYKNENQSIEKIIKGKSWYLSKAEMEGINMENELKQMKSEVAEYKLINKTKK